MSGRVICASLKGPVADPDKSYRKRSLDSPIHGVYNAVQFTPIPSVPEGGRPVGEFAMILNAILLVLVLALIIRCGVPPGVLAG